MGADILQVEVSVLRASIDRLKALYPELAEDEELLADTIEGSTNFDAMMDRLSLAFLERTALKEANAEVQRTLRERGERLDRKAEALRAVMMDLMVAAGKRKAELPTATLSVVKGRAVLELDEDFNAQGYMRVKLEPMRTDILAALSNDDDIPGARIVKTPDHLSVRTK